jgi:hypothetical protein
VNRSVDQILDDRDEGARQGPTQAALTTHMLNMEILLDIRQALWDLTRLMQEALISNEEEDGVVG